MIKLSCIQVQLNSGPNASKLSEYLATADEFITDSGGESSSTTQGQQSIPARGSPYLFEGQLSEVEFC